MVMMRMTAAAFLAGIWILSLLNPSKTLPLDFVLCCSYREERLVPWGLPRKAREAVLHTAHERILAHVSLRRNCHSTHGSPNTRLSLSVLCQAANFIDCGLHVSVTKYLPRGLLSEIITC